MSAANKTKEVLVYHDEGFFTHETGDTYEGGFEIKKKEMSLKMSGYGTYMTSEGDTYSGRWENDRLVQNEPTLIQYHEGSKFEGQLKDWTYNGPGVYIYPDDSTLRCEFSDNCPTGFLELTDPNGHTWLGKSDVGFAWFEPNNHYYFMLENTFESERARRHRLLKEGVLSDNWKPNAYKKKNK